MEFETIFKRLQRIISRVEASTGIPIHLQQNYLARKNFNVNSLKDNTIALVFIRNTHGTESYGHVTAYVYRSQQLWFIDSGGEAPSFYSSKLPPAQLVITKDIQRHHHTCAPTAILLCHLFAVGVSPEEIRARFSNLDLATTHSITRQYMDKYNVHAELPQEDLRFRRTTPSCELFDYITQKLGPAPTKGPTRTEQTPATKRKRHSRAQWQGQYNMHQNLRNVVMNRTLFFFL